MVWSACWSAVRHWVGVGTEWVERMWVREDRAADQRGAGEHRWTWIWLGQDATDADINELVRQVHDEICRLPLPLGIGDFMIAVTAWGPRRDGVGEAGYLEAKQAGDQAALAEDVARREPPKLTRIGDVARGHILDRQGWSAGGGRDQLRRALRYHRPSRHWRIVQVSLFSVGEAYLKLVARPAHPS